MWLLVDVAEAHGPETESRSWVKYWPTGHSAFQSEQEDREDCKVTTPGPWDPPCTSILPAKCHLALPARRGQHGNTVVTEEHGMFLGGECGSVGVLA